MFDWIKTYQQRVDTIAVEITELREEMSAEESALCRRVLEISETRKALNALQGIK